MATKRKSRTKYDKFILKFQQAQRQDHRCWVCGVRRSLRTFTMDHVQPLAYNGPDVKENIKLACDKCNCDRGAAAQRLEIDCYYREQALTKLEQLLHAKLKISRKLRKQELKRQEIIIKARKRKRAEELLNWRRQCNTPERTESQSC